MYEINSIDPYTDWRREEIPEGFLWDCCDEDINGVCCVVQRHIPESRRTYPAMSKASKGKPEVIVLD